MIKLFKLGKMYKLFDCFSEMLADIVEDNKIQTFIRRCLDVTIDTIIRASVLVFVVSLTLTIGPSIESRFLGVFNSWNADNYQLVNDQWEFNVYATNPWYRFNCLYVSNQEIEARAIILDDSGMPTETIHGTITPLEGVAIPIDNSSNKSYYGKWRLETDKVVPTGSLVTGTIHHTCHILWVTTTIFGPFQIKIP